MQEILKNEQVTAAVTIRSATGASILTTRGRITKANRGRFLPGEKAYDQALDQLKRLGFKILATGKHSVSIAGSQGLFEKAFKARLTRETSEIFRSGRRKREIQFFKAERPLKVPQKLKRLVESISLSEPPLYFQSADPPQPSYFHLDVPHNIASLMRASLLHNIGVDGRGIRMAMVDTGFYDHPYYHDKGYNITQLTVGSNSATDEDGHGTGIAACGLAVAPGVDFVSIKKDNSPLAGFQLAVAQNPHIITCSWGWDDDHPGTSRDDLSNYKISLEQEIIAAVEDGIVVLFACGNGHHAWPASIPEVIAVGGAYIGSSMQLQVASYASSFYSSIYPGRHCPDVCGLCGMRPDGIYIVEPTQPGSYYDDYFSDNTFPNGDETADDDGWVVMSGTSSATPMVAGAVALRLQRYRWLTPDQIRTDLERTARDVRTGQSRMGDVAAPGWDDATGAGLVDANALYHAAVTGITPCALPPHCPPSPYIQCISGPACPSAPIPCIPEPIYECRYAPIEPICPSFPREILCPPNPPREICPSAPGPERQPPRDEGCHPGPRPYAGEAPAEEPKPKVRVKRKAKSKRRKKKGKA